MKILYSQIKHLVPDLQADARQLGEALTMIGLMMDSFETVRYQGQADYLLGLETRNRVDCLSVWGVARETAAYYNLEANIPVLDLPADIKDELTVKNDAGSAIKRIRAVKIDNVVNQDSPDWLKEFLTLYEINSINLLVDLSNYVMIMTGYASHLLDCDKLSGSLIWKLNQETPTMTTLDGAELKLNGGELIISDDKNILALAGLIGSQSAAIDSGSRRIIAEMAIYDHALIKQNSRALAIVTEAGNRLSKEMDPRSLAAAFDYLLDLILTLAGGQAVAMRDYYPAPKIISAIPFQPESAGRFAGIDISSARAMDILKSLRCQVAETKDGWLVTPPADRQDLSLPEDLTEEVIRMVRYDSIPSTLLPALPVTADLTKPIYRLKEKLRDTLAARGFDEVLTQPLVAEEANKQANYLAWEQIATQNSVNEEFPALRLSLACGLFGQADEYLKKNVAPIKIFEIGKVFGIIGKDYSEAEHLACLLFEPIGGRSFNVLRRELAMALGQIGITGLSYSAADMAPAFANPHSAYIIKSGQIELGIIYKARPLDNGQAYVAEIDLSQATELSLASIRPAVAELTGKLISLDANVELSSTKELNTYLAKATKAIGADKLWNLSVVDEYRLDNRFRYTVRAVYAGLTDQEAKEAHNKIFGL